MVSTRKIFLFLVVFGILALVEPTSRILGGGEASKNSFPYVASIRLDGAHICGGSIVTSKTIITAAHCLFENGKQVSKNRLAVRVGSTNQFSGGKLVSVSNIIVHPDYSGVKNDIAFVVLQNALQRTPRIQLIRTAYLPHHKPGAAAFVTVAGWGEQSPDVSSHKLHAMEFSISNDEECSSSYSEHDNSTICLKHELKRGSCTGDAGNGAVYNNRLIAVSSFVIGACGSRYPDVFTNVLYYENWIESVLSHN